MSPKFLKFLSFKLCLARRPIYLAFAISVFAQQTLQVTVSAKDDIEQINDAVLISNIAVTDKTVECGLFIKPPAVVQPVAPFPAGSDWLQQMTISLVNRTDKMIDYGSLILHFMDTGDCQSTPCAGANLVFGKRPSVDAFDYRTGRPLPPDKVQRSPVYWKPETTLVIHVSDYLQQIERQVERFTPVTTITNVKIYRGIFFFGDGMYWQFGKYGVPDAEHPGKFKLLPANYFPGRRAHNWPPGYNQ